MQTRNNQTRSKNNKSTKDLLLRFSMNNLHPRELYSRVHLHYIMARLDYKLQKRKIKQELSINNHMIESVWMPRIYPRKITPWKDHFQLQSLIPKAHQLSAFGLSPLREFLEKCLPKVT